MIIKIFDKDIEIRDYYCQRIKEEPIKKEHSIKNVGLVTLMNYNEFCADNKINLYDIEIKNKRFITTDYCFLKDICQCSNHVYITEKRNMIKLYHKNTEKPKDIIGYLVFDGKNLKNNYSEDINF